MSSGHASHKGASIKSDTNINDQIDENPDAVPTEGYGYEVQEMANNPAALERPDVNQNQRRD